MSRAFVLWSVLFLAFSSNYPSSASDSVPTGTVHIKIMHAPNADDLGTAKVTFFKSQDDERDYAKQFRNNLASRIPYGVYQLRVYRDGFYSAERQVVVDQPDVWVVIGLDIGGLGSDGRIFKLSGTVRNMPSTNEPVWVRLTGVRSTQVADGKVDDSGNFLIAGLRQDSCVLVVWSGTRILHVRPVTVPSNEPLLIELE